MQAAPPPSQHESRPPSHLRPDSESTVHTLHDAEARSSGDVSKKDDASDEVAPVQPPPYSIYSYRHKWALVSLVAAAGIFSPMSANIFWPAIPDVAESLSTTVQNINLSVTVYMVAQGITPTAWGAICDVMGRRPVFLATFIVYIGSCIGLANTKTYGLLVALRFLQAAGSASVNSVGAGFVGDIAAPSERGGFMGIYQLGPMLGPCLGPVIGGLLSQAYGWQSIFAFSAAFAGIVLILMGIFLPETLRSIVGNGSIPARGVNRTLVSVLSKKSQEPISEEVVQQMPKRRSWREIDLLGPLRMFLEKDVLMILTFNAICYTLFYTVITSTSDLFQEAYGLSTSQVGLCYLAFGGGCILAAALNTKRLDRDYKAISKRELKNGTVKGMTEADLEKPNFKVDLNDLSDFPIEEARLRSIPYYFAGLVVATIGYGWVVQKRVHLAVPLIFQFIIGVTSTTQANSSSTLLVDLFPGKSASSIASMNLSRCLLGGGGTAVINLILRRLGPGWTYTMLSLIAVLFFPLNLLEIKYGRRFRAERKERLAKRAAAVAEKEQQKQSKV